LATGQVRAPEDNGSASEQPTEPSGLADRSPELTNVGSSPSQTSFPGHGGFESQLSVAPSVMPAQWGGAAEVTGHAQSAVDAGLSGPDVAGVARTPSASNWQSALFAGLESTGMNPNLLAALGMLGGASGGLQNSAKDATVSQLNGYLSALGVGSAGAGPGDGTSTPSGAAPEVNLGSHNPSLYGADSADGGTDGGLNGSGTVGPQDSRATWIIDKVNACMSASASVGPFDFSCSDAFAGAGKGLAAALTNPARDDPGAPRDPATAHNEAVDQQNKQSGTSSSSNGVSASAQQKAADATNNAHNEASDESWMQLQQEKKNSEAQDTQKNNEAVNNAVKDPEPGQVSAMYDPDVATGAVGPPSAQQVGARLGQAEHTINPDDGIDPSEPVEVSSASKQPGTIDPTIANIDSELGQSMTGMFGTPKIDIAPIDKVQGWDEQNAPGGAPRQGGTTPNNAQTVPH